MAVADIAGIVHADCAPRRRFRLKVSELHELHVEEGGNPAGVPLVMLHGGPGGRIERRHRQLADPRRYRFIAFDQRGAGRSSPAGAIEDNDTWRLVADIETVRRHFGVERWHVAGGSWGSTLALAYAQTHPERVRALCLWGVWLGDRTTQRWLFDFGANMVYPEAWDRFVAHFDAGEREDLEAATYRRLAAGGALAASTARALAEWEAASVRFHRQPEAETGDDDAEAYGRIMGHYFRHGCFLDGDDRLLARCGALKGVPGIVVHGRFDMCTPLQQAWALARAWPGAELRIVEHGGHMCDEPGMARALVAALDELAAL